MAFHISPKDGQPRPCKAATPESCPVGGEHFDSKETAQSTADAKLASEYSTTGSLSRKVDFTKREPMQKLPDGRYAVEPGEYYIVNDENMDGSDDESRAAIEAVVDPNDDDTWANKMRGGYIDGEPVYATREHWSGVSNCFVTPKLYESLVKKGVTFPYGDKPPVVVFTKPTTLGAVDGNPNEDNPDYGLMEVGDKKVDLFYGDDSIIQSERTVID